MDTDREMYIAWLEIQMKWDKLLEKWDLERRGKNADDRGTEKKTDASGWGEAATKRED